MSIGPQKPDLPGSLTRQGVVFLALLAFFPVQTRSEAHKSVALAASLVPADGVAQDFFGTSIDLSGSRAVVGAPGSNAVYLFEFDGAGWSQQAKLTPFDGVQGDQFGRSVAVDGNRVVVGAPGHAGTAPNAGAVYIFQDNGAGWSGTQKLSAPLSASSGRFGTAVDLLGDRLLAGAPDENSLQGSAYVYDFLTDQWILSQQLTAATGSPGKVADGQKGTAANFGFSVSLGPDRALVGAPEEDNARGAAYVFAFSGVSWGLAQRLAPGFLEDEDLFGASVSLSGDPANQDRLLVGLPGSNRRSGSAEIFDLVGQTWQVSFNALIAEDATEVPFGSCGDQLGSAVSLWGDYALVGAATDAVWGDYAGSAYLYQIYQDEWFRIRKVTESSGAADRLFGQAVALDGGLVVVGAPAQDVGLRPCSSGAAASGAAGGEQLVPNPALGVQPDQFEVDNTPGQANDIQVGMQFRVDEYPQRHNLHVASDVDYVRFLYNPTSSYTIRVQPRDTTLNLGIALEDAHGVELPGTSTGCGGSGAGFEVNTFPPNGLSPSQILLARVFECVPGTATGTRDYDIWVAGIGHQQCVLLEGNVSTRFTGTVAPFIWLFSDVNNTVITSPAGFYQLCADYDIRELTTFDPTGASKNTTVDVLAGVACAPGCIEPDYEDDDGNIRPRIKPGTRARLDFEVSGPVIFVDGFEAETR